MSGQLNKGIKNTGSYGKRKQRQKSHRYRNVNKDLIYANPKEDTFYGFITDCLGDRHFMVRILMENGNVETLNCQAMKSLSRKRIYVNKDDYVLVNKVVGTTYQIVQKFNLEQIDQLESTGEIDTSLLRGEKETAHSALFQKKLLYADEDKGIFYGKITKVINITTYTIAIVYNDVFNPEKKKCDIVEATINSRLTRIGKGLQIGNIVLTTKLAKRMYQITYVYDVEMSDRLIEENVFNHDDFDGNDEDDEIDDIALKKKRSQKETKISSIKPVKVKTRDELVDDAFAGIMGELE